MRSGNYMSKMGIKPISIPSGVTIEVKDGVATVRGSKGELKQPVPEFTTINIADGEVTVDRKGNSRQAKANHGLARSLINNMIIGVSNGFEKKLELVGTGYRVASKGAGLSITVGFSHPVEIDPVPGVNFSIEGNNVIIVQGIDKQLVGQIAADIRKIRPPEPYNGKGIRYQGEYVRRKAGKTAVA